MTKKMTSFPKLHFHFMGEYSKLDKVKTMGTRGKINAI